MLALIRLVIAYFKILFATILSPLVILVGTLPGQERVIGDFFKRIAVNVLTFPAVLFFLLLGSVFVTRIFTSFIFPDFGGSAATAFTTTILFATGAKGMIWGILSLIAVYGAWKAPSMLESAFGLGGPPKGKK